ncbi:phenylalanine--tRNA ligase subunit beta [Enterobacteriaceae endosymbiont of Plateumaris rustica]|uniref:phenylalanine--tRNA ligase subunit beta n=1 Tax=Enterobacteriaceae endosymbiont of Plateumaris rustica TaxID=2675796 RepID=UPI001448C3AE|nr:phenylalanine--tRNA ligase subunit beta [Enterobacteriaceae endosymbiont of Plateumaris rustica]QJC28970.1 phenylalanine--tRNA ligase subunit beta [Enterobacteriaceae endosymbiont of Plateumaris rustica]
MIKLSELWLREWIPYNNNKLLSEQLTMLGLEVEKIVQFCKKKLDNIFIGQIIDCQFNNDKNIYNLIINIGNNKLYKIKSNAINCKNKIKIIFATVNSSLYKENIKNKKFDFLLKSEGLLCSKKMLGLKSNLYEDNKNYIIQLNNNIKIGQDACKYLQLNDNIFHINIPYNRSDCLSVMGIARDLFTKIKKNNYSFTFPYKFSLTKKKHNNKINVYINKNANKYNLNYFYCIIQNINLHNEIPFLIEERLQKSGILISNNNPLLNISNYVNLELGYPVYFYDFNKIKGDIFIEEYKNTNNYSLIDETNNKISLLKNTLIIKDEKNILSIPSLIQNKKFMINVNTKNILLECFFLDPNIVKKLSNKYKTFNLFSHLYERGLDPLIQKKIVIRTIDLILKIYGGERSQIKVINTENYINNYLHLKKIKLNYIKIEQTLGFFIKIKKIFDIINKLGFKIILKTEINCILQIPSWRYDIQIEADIIEEIIRIYGYNNIPDNHIKLNLTENINENFILNKNNLFFKSNDLKKIKNILINKGYNEVINYSFINPKIQTLMFPKEKFVKLYNPISIEMSIMRTSLLCGLINNIIYNQNRQQKSLRFFESGLCFKINKKLEFGISQKLMFGGIINGKLHEEHWSLSKKNVDFYDLKGDIECIFHFLGKIDKIEFRSISNISFLHPYQGSSIYLNNTLIGHIGVINPYIKSYLGINENTILFELECNEILHHVKKEIKTISNLPLNRRDISLIVKENIPFINIMEECKNSKIKQIIDINLFDVYKGISIPKGYKSFTISFIIQDNIHTLKDHEINNIIQLCINKLKKKFNIVLRDTNYDFN